MEVLTSELCQHVPVITTSVFSHDLPGDALKQLRQYDKVCYASTAIHEALRN
jgi:hypothetical protein